MSNLRPPAIGFWLGAALSVAPMLVILRSYPSQADDVDGFSRTLILPFIAAGIAAFAAFLTGLYQNKHWAKLILVGYVPFGIIWTLSWFLGDKALPAGYGASGSLTLTAYIVIGAAGLCGLEYLAVRNLRKNA